MDHLHGHFWRNFYVVNGRSKGQWKFRGNFLHRVYGCGDEQGGQRRYPNRGEDQIFTEFRAQGHFRVQEKDCKRRNWVRFRTGKWKVHRRELSSTNRYSA